MIDAGGDLSLHTFTGAAHPNFRRRDGPSQPCWGSAEQKGAGSAALVSVCLSMQLPKSQRLLTATSAQEFLLKEKLQCQEHE